MFFLRAISSVALVVMLASLSLIDAFAVAPDPGFHAPRFSTPTPDSGVLSLPDGKFLRFFNSDTIVEVPTAGPLTRYLADGSLDNSFQFSRNYYAVITAFSLPDGKLIVAALRTTFDAFNTEELLRLNSDGSIDPIWGPVTVSATDGFGGVRSILQQPDGKFIVSGQMLEWNGDSARVGIVRLNADGTLDTSFVPVPLIDTSTSTAYLALDDLILQPDGKIVIYGNFRKIGPLNFPSGIARLNSDGSVDGSFNPSGFTRSTWARTAVRQVDGKIVLGGRFSVTATFAANPTGKTYNNLPFIRLNADGSADQTFGYFNTAAPALLIRDSVLQPDGKIVGTEISGFTTVLRFNTNGTLDTSFHQADFQVAGPGVIDPRPAPYRLYRLSDGRLLTGGTFSDVDRATPNESNFGIARLNSDGTVDTTLTLNIRSGVQTYPVQALLSANGKTFISFSNEFSATNDTPVPNDFGRVKSDGTLDNSYNPFVSPPAGAPLQNDFICGGFVPLPNDELFLYGTHLFYGGFTYGKLLSSGTQATDVTVDATLVELYSNDPIVGMLQPSLGVLLCDSGAQALLYDIALVRLNFTGGRDNTFHFAQSIRDALIIRSSGFVAIYADARPLAVLPDGKILFVYLNSNLDGQLVRLNNDGSVDPGFNTVNLTPSSSTGTLSVVYDPQSGTTIQTAVYTGPTAVDAEVQSDGRIVIVGSFTAVNGSAAHGIARLNANGTVDGSFTIGSGPAWTTVTETPVLGPLIEQVETDTGGKLIITGTFEAFNGIAGPGIARLNLDGSVDTALNPPAVRNRYYKGRSMLARQPDGSFFLSGPYSYPNDSNNIPALLHFLGAPSIQNAVSRKTHGTAGSFDIPLALTGTPSVESRASAGGNYTIVITLNNDLASGSASITGGGGTVVGTPRVSGKTMAVDLTGVADAQQITVQLHNLTDVASQVLPDTALIMRFLIGDANSDGFVNSGDATQTRNRSGQTLDGTNFRSDINADGFINSGDATTVRAHSGNFVPSVLAGPPARRR